MSLHSIAVTLFALGMCGVPLAEPTVFSKRGLQNDKAVATARDRLHIVYATADWCPPCQKMKETTWTDDRVERWIEKHAVVSAVDVDESPTAVNSYSVRTLPTLILFDGSTEIGRFSGYRDAVALVSWLDTGRRVAAQRERSQEANAGGRAKPNAGGNVANAELLMAAKQASIEDRNARATEANALMQQGRFADAMRICASLWSDTPAIGEESQHMWLLSVKSTVHRLSAQHEPTRELFAGIRNRSGDRLAEGTGDLRTFRDWLDLNYMIHDYHATAAVADEFLKRPNGVESLARFSETIVWHASEIGRWDLVSAYSADPILKTRTMIANHLEIGAELAAMYGESHTLDSPKLLADVMLGETVIAVLHADDGGASERALIEVFEAELPGRDAWRAAFIVIAERCGKLRTDHLEWIEQYDLARRFEDDTVFAAFVD